VLSCRRARAVSSIAENVKLGLVFELTSGTPTDPSENPLLGDPALVGRTGGLHVGAGASAEFDSRDNIMYPSTGIYAFATAVFFRPAFGSDFAFEQYRFDGRAFFEPGAGQVIGLNLYSELVGGTPPFYEYALLGNDRVMRGYIQGRYRDRVYAAVQAEYRRRIWWRFGGVLFVGVGDVAPGISKFQAKHLKPNYGAGLRFVFDQVEKMDLRMDVGFGRGTSGVYFGVNQAF
jgi:outer membrane protein assembly factor BamA